MFRPNLDCVVRQKAGNDLYGMPTLGARKKERCAIVKKVLRNDKTSVRADSSASRGNAREMEANVLILMTATTTAEIDAVIDVVGDRFRVISKHGRYSIAGKLDHYELGCNYYSDSEE